MGWKKTGRRIRKTTLCVRNPSKRHLQQQRQYHYALCLQITRDDPIQHYDIMISSMRYNCQCEDTRRESVGNVGLNSNFLNFEYAGKIPQGFQEKIKKKSVYAAGAGAERDGTGLTFTYLTKKGLPFATTNRFSHCCCHCVVVSVHTCDMSGRPSALD